MLGKISDMTAFAAPAEPGWYRISAVRDFCEVINLVPGASKHEELVQLACKYMRKQQLAVLGYSKAFEVRIPESTTDRETSENSTE